MTIRRLINFLVITACFIRPLWSQQDVAEFQRLMDDVWAWQLEVDPLLASDVGSDLFQDRLPDDSSESIAQREAALAGFTRRLEDLPPIREGGIGDQIDMAVLKLHLSDQASRYRLRTHLMPINGREGFHVSFPQLAETMQLESERDFRNYVTRLAAFGRYADQQIALMQRGIDEQITQPAVILREIESQLRPHYDVPADQTRWAAAFDHRPDTIAESTWEQLKSAGLEAIEGQVQPAYRRFAEFLQQRYLPVARSTVSIAALEEGREIYRDRIAYHTTTNLSAEAIHQIGVDEVARIQSEMRVVMRQLNFDGDLKEFIEHLQSDPQHYASSPEELLQFVAGILKHVDGQLPRLFRTLPRTPYGLKPVPDYVAPQTTSAYYWPPAGDGTRAGFFYLNTYNLRQRPKFEMEALSLHEAVPGHHLQIALQQELTDVHPLRKFTLLTAFVEGWGLYAESLGDELGLYQDPYQRFGRLSFESWRACRLVVDTGIHAMGWTREEAIRYMRQHTALSDHNIAAEVDRYIGWPGQALAYKIGELKIQEVKRRAKETLGDRWDIRGFHQAVLANGAVPLDILDDQVQRWLAGSQ